MTGLDTILESIRSEGRRTADGILEKARKDADEILSRGETDASLRREDILRGVENEARDTADRVLSSARREQRRTVLSARQEIIREVIEVAEQYLYGLSDDNYFKVLIGLAAKRAMPQKGEMVLGARDISRVPPDFEEKLRIADVYENLKKTANGEIVSDNSKITFERYIMGSYFEQVLYYANLRFSKMTGGRYEIVRGESRDKRISAGLEISARDNFNNKERDISSLSGGESFQASLALALGLSDIIQQRNGGIRLDSIFIDEGFGSLDNDSLASAIETLNDLTGNGNRLVGIISHISELKNSIGNKIEVVGTKSGSSIKIITD